VALQGHQCMVPHEYLSRQEVGRIVDGALEVLADTGMVVAHAKALALLQEAGCGVDMATQRVKFPRVLVEWAMAQSPATFEQQARNPALTLNWGGGTVYFGAFPGFTSLDLATRERRISTVPDLARLSRLCDAMAEVHTICQPTPHLSDKPAEVEMEWVLATTFRNTEKTTMGAAFAGCSRWVVEMCQVLGQQVHGSICMASPLTIPVDQAQGVLDYAGAGHPLHLLSGPMRGASGPATMAGTLVLQTAEILGGHVLGQLVRPGNGAIYVGYATPMDMRLGTMASGSIDVGIMGAASGQIARYLGMPSAVFFPMTDAKLPDAQASYERHLQALLCAQAGVNHIMALGGLENEGAFSPEQMVIDNEVCGMIAKVLDGIRVDDERLAIQLIKDVGPIPGNYLGKDHTRKHWREDYFLPKVSVREGYDAWLAGGSKGALERAAEIAAHLMATHQVKPLPPEVDCELDRILAAVEAEKLGTAGGNYVH
jgi:trimethylamine---corrinoid protein Co-methyltransferase